MERSKKCSRKRRQGSGEDQRVDGDERINKGNLGSVLPPRTSNLALFYLGQLLIALHNPVGTTYLDCAQPTFTAHSRLQV